MPTDACREFRGAIAAAAIGRIEPAEEIALRAHLDGCADCRHELEEVRRVAKVLPLADVSRIAEPADPPPALGGDVLRRVASARDRQRRHRALLVAAIAAAIAVIVGASVAFLALRSNDDTNGTRIAFPVLNGAGGRATLEARDTGTEVELIATGLHDGDWYWLWLTGDDGKRVGAGTFRGRADGCDVTLTSALYLEDTRRIWVTDADDKVVLDARLPST
jgi:hypothetical protein